MASSLEWTPERLHQTFLSALRRGCLPVLAAHVMFLLASIIWQAPQVGWVQWPGLLLNALFALGAWQWLYVLPIVLIQAKSRQWVEIFGVLMLTLGFYVLWVAAWWFQVLSPRPGQLFSA